MSKFDDAVINPILQKLAIKHNITTEQVREVLMNYYQDISYIIESGQKSQIKIEHFGKIAAKDKFDEMEEKAKDFVLKTKGIILENRTYDL
jgi:nucleoid DNA-binding protein